MKKISNIRQLKAEQEALKKQQVELETAMHNDWLNIKESLRPKNITGQVLSSMFSKPEPGEKKSMIPWVISLAVAGITGKVIGKTKKKIHDWLN